jgi:hypothetical protein
LVAAAVRPPTRACLAGTLSGFVGRRDPGDWHAASMLAEVGDAAQRLSAGRALDRTPGTGRYRRGSRRSAPQRRASAAARPNAGTGIGSVASGGAGGSR